MTGMVVEGLRSVMNGTVLKISLSGQSRADISVGFNLTESTIMEITVLIIADG